jgi:formamidopyrimidine-DNA glycosylase
MKTAGGQENEMPELPEVESVARALAPALTGRRFGAVRVLSASSASRSPLPLSGLTGRTIERIGRRAKYLLVDLSGDWGLAVHLRMTGWLGVREGSAEPDDLKHVRVLLALAGDRRHPPGWLVFRDIRRFGRLWCGPREQLAALPELKKLGPEPLEIGASAFATRLKERRGRLKSLLLDQRFLAGLGNIYVDEALHGAGLHPLREAARVSRTAAEELHASIQDVLRRAIRAGGTTRRDYFKPDGSPGWFKRALKVYGREGEACRTCGTGTIRRIVVGQRGTWFCPKCQRR